VNNEILSDQLYQLNVHKPVGPDKNIHPRVLKEIADVMAGPPLSSAKGLGSLGRSLLTRS